MEDTKEKFKLQEKNLKICKILLLVTTAIVILVCSLTMGYISKNLTYTHRFTPPSMQSLLQNNYIYYYSQVLIIIINLLLMFSTLFQCFTSFKLKSKIFNLSLAGNIFLWASCLTVTLLFLCGGW